MDYEVYKSVYNTAAMVYTPGSEDAQALHGTAIPPPTAERFFFSVSVGVKGWTVVPLSCGYFMFFSDVSTKWSRVLRT